MRRFLRLNLALLVVFIASGMPPRAAGQRSAAALQDSAAVDGVCHVPTADNTLDGDDLRTIGIGRLGDLARHIPTARILTIDGFDWRLRLHGLSSFHGPGPDVFIDFGRVDLSLFDMNALNLVGIPVEAIERVDVYRRAVLICGVFAGNGAVHIVTRAIREGIHGAGAVSAENEVGDPGPFAYREGEVRPNIDTQGPDGRIVAEGGRSTAGVRASAVYHRFYLTKPDLLERLGGLQAFADAPVIDVRAPALNAALRRPELAAGVLALGVSSRLYPFVTYASSEASAIYRAVQVSANLHHSAASNGTLDYRVAGSAKRAEEPGDSSVPFQWEEASLDVHSSFSWSVDRVSLSVGGSGRVERARAVGDAVRGAGGIFAQAFGVAAGGWQFGSGAEIAFDGDHAAIKVYGDLTYRLHPTQSIRFSASVVDALPSEQGPSEDWVREGLAAPLAPGLIHYPDARVARRVAGDLEYRLAAGASHKISLGLGIRISDGSYLYDRIIERTDTSYRTNSLTFDYADGSLGAAWIGYDARVLPGTQTLFWSYETPISGGRLFEQAWRAVPDAQYGASILLPAAADFHVGARLARQSSSRWREFEDLEETDADVPAATLLDVSLYKRLAAGHVHLRLSLTNLLRRRVRYHPIGDTFDLSARIDLRVEFGKSP